MKLQNFFSKYAGRQTNLEAFRSSEELETPAGKLFIALIDESSWSREYAVTCRFDDGLPRITIEHESFKYQPLGIQPTDWEGWTVRRVEDAVRKHLDEQMRRLRAEMAPLQEGISDMDYALGKIDKDKARAAVEVAFPEEGPLTSFTMAPATLYCFGTNTEHSPTYIVRMLGHEPAGGVARISDMSPLEWHVRPSGVEENCRLGCFWTALAKTFASRKLAVPEEDLQCVELRVVEEPREQMDIDPYVVDWILFRQLNGPQIEVTFGKDNLPATAAYLTGT